MTSTLFSYFFYSLLPPLRHHFFLYLCYVTFSSIFDPYPLKVPWMMTSYVDDPLCGRLVLDIPVFYIYLAT